METVKRLIEKARNWYDGYTAGSLAPSQRKFWIVFWSSVVISCAVCYLYTFYVSDYWGSSKPKQAGLIVSYVCILLPALVLRRLHLYGLFFAGYFLTKWLGVSSLAFWLLIGVNYIRRKRASPAKE